MHRTTENSGIYLLEIYAGESYKIKHKKFDGIIFPNGWYYYSGSAQKNLSSRIKRHLLQNKKLFWHIDFITTLQTNVIKSVIVFKSRGKKFECRINKEILKKFNLKTVATGFGNTDCNSCPSHLLYSNKSIQKKISMNYPEAINYVISE